jgi:hypothetical protein
LDPRDPTVRQARRVGQLDQRGQPELRDQLDLRAVLRVLLALQAITDQLDRLALQEVLALMARQAPLELQAQLVLRGGQPAPLVIQGHLARPVRRELQVLLVRQVQRVQMDRPDLLDPLVQQEIQDRQGQRDLQAQQAQLQVQQVQRELMALTGQLVLPELHLQWQALQDQRDLMETPVRQVLQVQRGQRDRQEVAAALLRLKMKARH